MISLLTAFVSCKKEDTPKEEKISSENPIIFSKNIKVYHGERIQGAMPVPAGTNAPVIEAPGDGSVIALAGRFAIIKPELLNGEIAGYYLAVNGAPEYFKIDFNKPRLLTNGKGIKPKKRISLLRPFGTDSTGNTNGDSSIVITLPPNIQTPDTICVTYSPYDVVGNIGQPVTTCVIINHLGGDASNSWLNGTWRLAADRENADSAWESYSEPGEMSAIKDGYGYYCGYDSLSGQNRLLQKYCWFGGCSDVLAYDSLRIDKDSLTFNENGIMNYLYEETGKYANYYNLPCDQLNFRLEPFNYSIYGSWSAENNRLILVYEFIWSGEPEYDAIEVELTRISDTEFIITNDDGYQTKCKRI